MAGDRTKSKEQTAGMTRRELLRSAGVSVAVGASTLGVVTSYAKTAQQSGNSAGSEEAYEQLTTEQPDMIEPASQWAIDNGFDRLRIADVDLTKVPDFTKTLNI